MWNIGTHPAPQVSCQHAGHDGFFLLFFRAPRKQNSKMKTCYSCGADARETAATCPQCFKPMESQFQTRREAKTLSVLIAEKPIAFMACIFGMLASLMIIAIIGYNISIRWQMSALKNDMMDIYRVPPIQFSPPSR
ncbi:MAG: hypothetical protein NTV93_19200 [Verrucomicrobia bacterium]|nr:hypothetical protein [Verrucomicrobiota bacterium]